MIMINYLTKNEYTGQNIDILMASGYQEGDSFLTFKQALKLDGVNGQTMKGLKKCATLMFVKEYEDKETGKMVKKPKYFSVFDAKEILARINKEGS
jgi:antirestriction protein ArdC